MPPDPSARVSLGKDVVAPVQDADVRMTGMTAEKSRLCIQAAELRAKHVTFAEIARRLHFASPMVAKRAVQTGLTLIPSEDVREVRRLSDQRLDRIARGLLEVIESPGPLVSQGKVMRKVVGYTDGKPIEGDDYPDQMVRVRAYEALLKVDSESRKLHGADAPRRSVTITSDMITARIAELKAELGIQGSAAALGMLTSEVEPGERTI